MTSPSTPPRAAKPCDCQCFATVLTIESVEPPPPHDLDWIMAAEREWIHQLGIPASILNSGSTNVALAHAARKDFR